MRCESSGELYPLTTTFRAIPSSSPLTFAVLSPHVWHFRLGHPGDVILSTLRRSNSIDCNKQCLSFLSVGKISSNSLP